MKSRRNKSVTNPVILLLLGGLAGVVSACSPHVTFDAPKEPIMINMNVKIEHEIRIKVDKELDNLIHNDPTLF